MAKIPRGISGKELVQRLRKFEYKVIRQTGSHIQRESNFKNTKHKITIPDHHNIKIGTLK